jgi:hypothetical protein
MSSVRAFLRRHAPLLLVLAGIAWITAIVVMIIAGPRPGGGSPM